MMNLWENLPQISYASGLHEHLKGMAIDCSSYSNQNVYQFMSICMFFVCLAGALNFYFGVFDRPIFSNHMGWFTNGVVLSLILSLVGFFKASAGLPESNHCSDLIFFRTDCIFFAINIFIYSNFLFFLFSLILKWFSVDNKKVPF